MQANDMLDFWFVKLDDKRHYVDAKQEQNVVDHDFDPELSIELGARFDHVLVDEF